MEQTEPVQPRNVLVLGASGSGDTPPLIAASLALKQRGHQINCLGDEMLAEATKNTGLAMATVSSELTLASFIQRWIVERLENPDAPLPLSTWAESLLPQAIDLAESSKADLLMCSDFTAPLGRRVREEIGVPLCVVNATYYVGPGARRRPESDYGTRWEAALMVDLINSGDLVLHATDDVFDPPPEQRPPNHHWIGTLIWEPTASPTDWLDSPGDPWALMTLSSGRQEGEMELARAAVEAMSSFPVRTLLTLADARSEDSLAFDTSRVRVETFVPHSAVLERAALCVAHAGHGIVAKALNFGVPMVLVPWGRDQPGVAARAEALGVACVVRREDLTPSVLADAISEVLETPSYADRAKAHATRIRRYDANARVCNLIEEFLER